MAWGSPMSERSRNSNIYVFEICRLWCRGCHRRKKSDPWPLLYYLYTCISPEGKILDKGGCCMYWVASTVSPTFLCFLCWSCMLTHWILLAPGFDQPPWHVNHQCQTTIFSWGRSSNKASENVSFEIYQVGSLDCESSQKYTSILLPDKFRPVCNLLFKWYHYNRTVSVTSYLYLVIWLRGSTVHYSSALYALALPRTLAGHKLASNISPSLLKCDNSLCMSWNMSSFYVHLILYGYLQIGKNNSTIPSYEKLRIK